MECGFLVENIMLTLACVGIVAIFRELYLAWLWRNIAQAARITVEIECAPDGCIEFAQEYIKWSSICAEICAKNDQNSPKIAQKHAEF